LRVRILRARYGEIEGVDLSRLEVGIAYNLSTTLAAYLVLTQSAEAVDPGEPDRPDTMLYHGVLPAPDVVDDAFGDQDFIEILDHVCNTAPIVVEYERPSDVGPKSKKPDR
jgi:hypothetical protein